MLTVAEGMNDPDARGAMLDIAEQYEELAQRSERFERQFGKVDWADQARSCELPSRKEVAR
jgi:hypothetical protein